MTYYDSTNNPSALNQFDFSTNNEPDKSDNSAPPVAITSQPMSEWVVTNNTIETYLQTTSLPYSDFVSMLSPRSDNDTSAIGDQTVLLSDGSELWSSIMLPNSWELPVESSNQEMQPVIYGTGLESQEAQALVQLPKTLSLCTVDGALLEVRLGSQAPQAADGSELSDADQRLLAEAFTVGKRGLAQIDTVTLPGEIEFQRIIYQVARDSSIEEVTTISNFTIVLLANSKNRVHSCLVYTFDLQAAVVARFIGQTGNKRKSEDTADNSEKRQKLAEDQATSSASAMLTPAPAANPWNGPDDFDSDAAVLKKFTEGCRQAYYQTTRGQKALEDGENDLRSPYDHWVETGNAFNAWQATRTFKSADGKTVVQGLRQLAKQWPPIWPQAVHAFQMEQPKFGTVKNGDALNHLFKLMTTGEMVTAAGKKHVRAPQLHPMHQASFDRYCEVRKIPSNYRNKSDRSRTHAASCLLEEIRKREANSNGNPIAILTHDGTAYSRMDPQMLFKVDPQAFNNAVAAFPDASDYADWIRNGGQ